MKVKVQDHLEKSLALAVFFITIGSTPFFSYDPINIPKFSLLVISGLYITYQILLNNKQLNLIQNKFTMIFLLLFIIFILFSTIKSNMPWPEKIYGVEGRNTGSVTYLMLIIILIGSMLSNSRTLGNKLVWVLNTTGVISAFYGLIQILGRDPFDWINPYSPVFGFFGNPNFFASFIGIAAAGAINKILDKTIPRSNKNFWLLLLFLYVLNIYESKSQQGFLILLTVCSTSIFLWLRTNKKFSKFTYAYLTIVFLGITAILLDIFQKSPWQSYLYKQSVTFRGDYWQAGWKMATENPLTGVGLDGYRDEYRAALEFSRAARTGAGEVVDSAHNVFIDVASGGGFILLFAYIAILLLATKNIKVKIKSQSEFDSIFATLLAAWLGYIVQSSISINQIGLAIWGWSLTGYLLSQKNEYLDENNNKFKLAKLKHILLLAPFLILSLAITIPIVSSDYEYRSAAKSGDVIRIEKSLQNFPNSVIKYNYIAQLFESNGFPDRSIVIARQAIEVNPKNYEAWQTLLQMSKATEQEKVKAKSMMNLLNPNLALFK
jgi:O-antigen ligase